LPDSDWDPLRRVIRRIDDPAASKRDIESKGRWRFGRPQRD